MTADDTERIHALYSELRAACLEVFERHDIGSEHVSAAALLSHVEIRNAIMRNAMERQIACGEKIEAVYCGMEVETGLSRSAIKKIRREER